MGNGFFSCKSCSEYCIGRTHVEINNNLISNYNNLKLNKSKTEQRIITNIFIPNCKLEISQDNSNFNQNVEIPQEIKEPSKIKIKNCENKRKESGVFTQYLNDVIKNEKNTTCITPSFIGNSNLNNQSNNQIVFNKYNIETLNYLNKIRNNPKLIIEDIDHIIKNNINLIDGKEYIKSDNTNEVIKMSINLEKIKDILIMQEPVHALKLNNQLKINHELNNVEFTDKTMNELIMSKKKEIINNYSECIFYPTFIKDITLNFIVLLDNNKIRDKLFNNNINYCYITTFNEKNNRFFGILCLA